MTALVPREVERTFSNVDRFCTGLAGRETHQPDRQDLGQFGQFRCPIGINMHSHDDCKLTPNNQKS